MDVTGNAAERGEWAMVVSCECVLGEDRAVRMRSAMSVYFCESEMTTETEIPKK